ncbi:HEAT repeat domain-containing protein [Paenibacillus sp. PK3_47]|uniref:HEAT repeat domain-containing protein n=1 Tax=Paenibacillus sp. PK3_47 TaxID=2072642 RepID=UPI00201DA29B|nr:HEAT repeat domain-containing protein [Paenibacillus sp. PK3_47]UQZ36401.1 HEAT repeat domain-containing protein [Paenibacillus sp. PK3_47]
MSTALLQELHQEVRRLYIAGSDLAAGDFRLKRLLPQFQQLGERAAVFKKLGEGIAALTEPDGASLPASRLQELTLLLESVLYTQGSTAPDGAPGPVMNYPFSLKTELPYRKLAAVRLALTTTGSGRYETVVEAFKEGVFSDLRLLPLAIDALNDPYSAIADYAMTTILPSYGPAINGLLWESLDPKGGRREVRKLEVIGITGGAEWLARIFEAAEQGNQDMKIAAMEFMAGHAEYTPVLLEWSRENSELRKAAYYALARGGSAEGEARLLEAFEGKDREHVAYALAKWPSDKLKKILADQFLDEIRHIPEKSDDAEVMNTYGERIRPYLTVFNHDTSPVLYEVFKLVLKEYKRLSVIGRSSLITHAAGYIEASGTMEDFKLLEELAGQDYLYVSYCFRAAYKLFSPSELFERFVSLTPDELKYPVFIKPTRIELVLIETIELMVLPHRRVAYDMVWDPSRPGRQYSSIMISEDNISSDWDDRWLDWFMAKGAVKLVCAFARSGHEEAISFLKENLFALKQRDRQEIIPLIFTGFSRAGMEKSERQELLMTVLEKERYYDPYVFDLYLFQMLLDFPPGYISRIEALLPRFRYESKQQLEHLINHLQEKNKS